MLELLAKPGHLDLPLALGDQGSRTDDENGLQFPPCFQFLDDQARFDGLSDTYLVRHKEPGSI